MATAISQKVLQSSFKINIRPARPRKDFHRGTPAKLPVGFYPAGVRKSLALKTLVSVAD